jgi:hypothetical protein
MVNKNHNREAGLSLLLCFILLFSFLLKINFDCSGQNISKYYKSSYQSNGTLYFIKPQYGFTNNKKKIKFVYDITYESKSDTATFNFSYYIKSNFTTEHISFIFNNQKYSSDVKKLFVEQKKGRWFYRYSSKILYNDLNFIFNQTSKPEIILSSKQESINLNIKKKTWKKLSSITKKIFTLINLNK